ncbi:MarR family winged helix-turn-helix transcriptional regulator [Streptomyces sp. NPDC018031]|uniref:MarR family winged helix-turn-helix transcriptional regulator n=1 Tax=Streptomyces sp. NPDC018031 TaxID=3365033 RepID=UPI0037A950FE
MAEDEFGSMEAQRDRLMEGLRAFGANYTDFTQRFAAWLGLHSTDAAALADILYAEDQGNPLSPARLSERVSLSSGATTALLNRLEAAGHIVRSREHTDRRIVTLRSSPAIRPRAEEFFAPYTERMTAEMSQYTRAQLKDFEDFIHHLRGTMDSLLADEYRDPRPGGPSGHEAG